MFPRSSSLCQLATHFTRYLRQPAAIQLRTVHRSPYWPNTQPVTNMSESSLNGPVNSPEELYHLLKEKKKLVYKDLSQRKVKKRGVFTNSELSLKYVDVYGFDFDYTLVHYTSEMHKLIYELSRDRLVDELNYPSAIKGISFDPSFAIRGLHCDIRNGFLMKIDTFNHIQVSSVYRGHNLVTPDEIFEQYGGTHIPMHVMDDLPSSSNWKLTQFLDLFSIPEATLLADITQYLLDGGIPFDPEYLFQDVQNTVQEIHHLSLHHAITSDLDRYMEAPTGIPEFLNRLKRAGKKLFLITNSPYWFVDKGMCFAMKSSDWRDLFDVIIVEARKPSFYSEAIRPFRSLNSESMTPTWYRVTSLEQGHVYYQGNMKDFIGMTGWKGNSVLYFGDHVFSDLADPILQHGWKTGAIIPELEDEIQRASSAEFKENLVTLLAVESLLKDHQGYNYTDPELTGILERWKCQRIEAKNFLKYVHNPRFGSVFRTEKTPTYFSRRLATFANLYMGSLDNLMEYPLDFNFIPRRTALPHELDLNFDI